MAKYIEVPLEQLHEPSSAARLDPEDESITELAESIAQIGLINPITVKAAKEGFEVVAGHRRLLACRLINFSPVPCMLQEEGEDVTYEVMSAENISRKNLTPMEEAAILAEMQEQRSYGVKTLAKVIGKSPAWVKQRLDLLRLPPDLQAHIHKNGMAIETARVLAKVDDPDVREKWARDVIKNGVSTRAVILWVNGYLNSKAMEEFGGDARELATEDGPVLVPKGTCWVCGGREEYQNMKSIMLCPFCYRELLRAKLERSPDDRITHCSRDNASGTGPEGRQEAGKVRGEDGYPVQNTK